MLRLCAVALFVVLASCGGDSNEPSRIIDIDGDWQFTYNVSHTGLDVSCEGIAEADVNQSGGNFNGTVSGSEVCTGPGGTVTNEYSDNIVGGQIDGDEVSFSTAFCSFSGETSGDPVNRAEGDGHCDFSISGTTYRFAGTWEMAK